MARIEGKVVIGAPAKTVFARLADVQRAPEWTPNLLEVRRTSRTKAGRGLRMTLVAKVGGRESRGTGRCLTWDPPRSLVLESAFDIGATSTTTFELTDEGPGTRLTARVDYTLPSEGLGRFAGGLLGGALARRGLRKALAKLRDQLEAEEDASRAARG
jgi:uncharacterized protein YndB with AHSA1/START domain